MCELPARTLVVGTTGAGKTTMARALARRYKYTHVELDALYWGPNWTESTAEELRGKVEVALAGDTWVVDGNYGSVRDAIWSRAQLVIWLDYSLPLILWRLTRRTLWRNLTREELWNGNRDRFWEQFTRNGLFYWAITTHGRRRRQYLELSAGNGFPQARIVRLRSPREAKVWLRTIIASQ